MSRYLRNEVDSLAEEKCRELIDKGIKPKMKELFLGDIISFKKNETELVGSIMSFQKDSSSNLYASVREFWKNPVKQCYELKQDGNFFIIKEDDLNQLIVNSPRYKNSKL